MTYWNIRVVGSHEGHEIYGVTKSVGKETITLGRTAESVPSLLEQMSPLFHTWDIVYIPGTVLSVGQPIGGRN